MLIRRATLADASAILALVPRLVAFGPPEWREPSSMTGTDLAVIGEALRSPADDPAVFVAELDGAVAGFIHLTSVEDYYRRRPHGHVADIVVADMLEGKGIAQALMTHAEDWARARGYDWLDVSVFEQNARAEALYRKLGFRRDVIRMVKPLSRAP